jgi:hypothetical protein
MSNLRAFLFGTAVMILPGATTASEIELVKFVCTSEGAVVDVVGRVADLIIGLSPLPSGCAWLSPKTYGTIGDTMFQVDAPGGRVARISRVFADGHVGFSAGLIELLS